jgi:hypothetical protein
LRKLGSVGNFQAVTGRNIQWTNHFTGNKLSALPSVGKVTLNAKAGLIYREIFSEER